MSENFKHPDYHNETDESWEAVNDNREKREQEKIAKEREDRKNRVWDFKDERTEKEKVVDEYFIKKADGIYKKIKKAETEKDEKLQINCYVELTIIELEKLGHIVNSVAEKSGLREIVEKSFYNKMSMREIDKPLNEKLQEEMMVTYEDFENNKISREEFDSYMKKISYKTHALAIKYFDIVKEASDIWIDRFADSLNDLKRIRWQARKMQKPESRDK